MSPPTDTCTSRSTSMGTLAGCLFQSIIKFILIFSTLINTLFFTIYQITLRVLQMELLPCLLHNVNNLFPSMDRSHLFCRLPLIQHLFLFYRKLNIFLHQWVYLLRCLLQYVKLPICHSLWFTLKLSPQKDKISYMSPPNGWQLHYHMTANTSNGRCHRNTTYMHHPICISAYLNNIARKLYGLLQSTYQYFLHH